MTNMLKSRIKLLLAMLVMLAVFNQCSTTSKEKSLTEISNEDECCKIESSLNQSETSEITCPECGHKKIETLPTDVCTILYNCENCQTKLSPKEGDCCVFCTYGTHKCPSMQDE